MSDHWIRHNLKHGMEYQGKNVRINFVPDQSGGFAIYLDPNTKERRNTVNLFVGFKSGEIVIQDLVGNGESSQYQNKRYGTLLFNIAIQVIRVLYRDEPDLLVKGQVSNKSDSGDLDDGARRRNHFWKSFGFTLDDPTAHNTWMAAPIHALKVVDRGLVDGKIPTTLALSRFYRYFNRCLISEQDVSAIKEVNLDDLDHSGLPSKEKMAGLLRLARTQGRWIFGILASMLMGLGVALIVRGDFSREVAFNTITVMGVALFLFYILYLYKLVGLAPAYREHDKLSKKRNNALTDIRNKILEIEDKLQGAVERAYRALAPLHTSLREQELQETVRKISSTRIDYLDTWQYAQLIKAIQNLLSSPYTLGKDPVTDIEDFLFGRVCRSISNHALQPFLHRLDSDSFIFQLNRLLKQCDQNRLIVTDGTSYPTGFDLFVKHIARDVNLVEFYRSSEPKNNPELYIRFFLSEGCLDFRATLTVWKMIRAEELVRCLRALQRNSLMKKAFIKVDTNARGYFENHFLPSEPKETILEVMCFLNAWWMDEDDIDSLTLIFQDQVLVD